MKKTLILILILAAINANAAIWIVDNNSGATNADFTNLTDAVAAASDGDSLYVIGSGNQYGGVTINKQLTIIGPGNFLSQNPETQVNLNMARVSSVTFAANSSNGSVMTGLYISSNIIVQGSNITIQRNRLNSGASGHALTVSSPASNVLILQNYMYHDHYYTANYLINITSASNVIIENNYIYRTVGSANAIMINSSCSGIEINYNIIRSNVTAYYANIHSNILYSGTFTDGSSTCTYYNNVASGEQFGSENGNIPNVDMADVFAGTGSSEAIWMLSDTSPAIGTGYNGTDCGMFGGPNPYVLSQIPAIPSIYSIFAPTSASATQGLEVEVKVKAHN